MHSANDDVQLTREQLRSLCEIHAERLLDQQCHERIERLCDRLEAGDTTALDEPPLPTPRARQTSGQWSRRHNPFFDNAVDSALDAVLRRVEVEVFDGRL
jgi:hypothetical protein